jgi:hypothetical protein
VAASILAAVKLSHYRTARSFASLSPLCLFCLQRAEHAEGDDIWRKGTKVTQRRASKTAKARAEEILEIKPGSLTVHTAYLVLFVRLVVLAINGLNLGPRW